MDSIKQSIEKLSNDNYGFWSIQIKALLSAIDLWEVVSSECPEEEKVTESGVTTIKNENEIKLWKAKDNKALSIIILNVDKSQINLVKKAKSAKEAWNSLSSYHEKGTVVTMGIILEKLYGMKLKEGGDAEKHIYEMEELFDRLAALGIEFQEILKVVTVIQSLPPSYKPLASAIEARPQAEITMTVLKSKVLDEYQRVKHAGSEKHESDDSALRVTRPNFICNYCKQSGHIKRNCYKYKAMLEESDKQHAKIARESSNCQKSSSSQDEYLF